MSSKQRPRFLACRTLHNYCSLVENVLIWTSIQYVQDSSSAAFLEGRPAIASLWARFAVRLGPFLVRARSGWFV